MPHDILLDIVFNLKILTFRKEDHVMEVKDNIDSIYFIEEGIIDVVTYFEMNEFVIDRLGPGSVINYRAFFLLDQMYVNLKALTEVKILALPLKTLLGLVQKYGERNPSSSISPS